MDRGNFVYNLLENCDSMLDIGCASGYYTKLYAKKCKEIIGIDPNKDLVEKAKKENPELEFIEAGAENLPFKEETFNTVILSDVLEHVQDETKSLEEIYRVLKKDGILIITVPHTGLFSFLDVDNYSWRLRQHPKLYNFIHRLKGREAPKVKEGYTNKHRHYSIKDLRILLNKFEILNYKRRGLITGYIGNHLELFSRWIFNKTLKFNRIRYLDSNINFGRISDSISIIAKKSE